MAVCDELVVAVFPPCPSDATGKATSLGNYAGLDHHMPLPVSGASGCRTERCNASQSLPCALFRPNTTLFALM